LFGAFGLDWQKAEAINDRIDGTEIFTTIHNATPYRRTGAGIPSYMGVI
jgi:hypothetical protein